MMTERIDLPDRYRRLLEEILRTHSPGVEVWAYGSRINGRSHAGSDLDLVLLGRDSEPIPIDKLCNLENALRESNIPFLVDAYDWARLPESFHREIERAHVVLIATDMYGARLRSKG